jgi:hypothetical protein
VPADDVVPHLTDPADPVASSEGRGEES